MSQIPRSEFPRPDFKRLEWLSLNGEWDFVFDKEDRGIINGYNYGEGFIEKIIVPYCYQSELSGIDEKSHCDIVWYSRNLEISDKQINQTCLIKFGAVDYEAKLWVNGNYVGIHKGGHTQFTFDITNFIKIGSNKIVLRACDDREFDRPRGKQYWKNTPDRCWYTNTTGIWQSVWIEFVGSVYIDRIRITPNIDNRTIELEAHLNKASKIKLSVDISYNDKIKENIVFLQDSMYIRKVIALTEEDAIDEIHYWCPDNPCLYDIRLAVYFEDNLTDEVFSYFGMRKIECRGDIILLNNKVLYQKLILDQGYWKESLLTPPTDEAIRFDIVTTKAYGFNGVRKHQKFEDPRYYYWADKLGLLVWGELPSAYLFNSNEIVNLQSEWIEFINQSYNHPSIITWVPFNESWGVRNIVSDKRQQHLAAAFYYITKALDSTRIVSSNDGWEQIEATDIFGIHDYAAFGEEFNKRYSDFNDYLKKGIINRLALGFDQQYKGQPVMITEYGGIAFADKDKESWGYFGSVNSEEEFLERFKSITTSIMETPYIRGFCYTQLTDVMQEVNGLMTMDRKLKIGTDVIRKIIC